MTGFETVLLRVAGTAAGALLKSLLARAPGAGLAVDPARPAPRWRRPAELGDAEVRRLAEVLAARLSEATARLRLPEHERAAAVDAVGDAFAALGTLDAEALFAADLDPDALAAALPAPPPGLSPAAEALYARLTRLCCAHAVEYATTLPGFGARADVELVRRTGALTRSLERLQDRPDGSAHAFEERYAEYVARTHGRLQLFGLTLSRSRQEWPLDVAYISLAVSGEQIVPGEAGMHLTSMKAEQALGASRRMLLRGPAGSGKSTLVQWLALNAARRTFGPELRAWNGCVPFVLRLRSFTAAASLPLPEEFLRASGVPLTAPAGWAEDLMLNGRALVLVDGVDEVPQRLRTRTEAWLWSLITAFPKALYVVTTRPSAVPEDWLANQGFEPHSLLPMELDDIRAFVSHWHRAARAECPGEGLDAYETSLLEAVSARRDLARLATNPLMCALLCALNRDRRMHLPRARKELYDAALDMLLVRRDTEREISGVEGVYLTRDEQVLLLQRFAYWLIRNGQVEADRDEAVEMVREWLNSMPQVAAQGGAEQVFTHLLIRSGLLREPVKGSVDFVHRTFQDYLAAKAAVEYRDFGVLVKNAHDDTWDDVVRMAVGHARLDERTRILRGLLKRADKVKGARNRLILLAATCLEHAPELDPAIHSDIQSRTAELLPPRSRRQAEALAKAGELVLELLPTNCDLDSQTAEAVILTAAGISGPRAMEVIARFRSDRRPRVSQALGSSWGHFDAAEYADVVLAGADLGNAGLLVSTPEQAACLDRLPHIKRVNLHSAAGLADVLDTRSDLEWLFVYRNEMLTELAPLRRLDRLQFLGLSLCPGIGDLEPLADLPLHNLSLYGLQDGLPLGPLQALALDSLHLGYRAPVDRVGALPVWDGLQSLSLGLTARDIPLDGLERWRDLRSLAISGNARVQELVAHHSHLPVTHLDITEAAIEPARLTSFEHVTDLSLNQCAVVESLEPLIALPHLRRLVFNQRSGCVDLTPLAGAGHISIEVYGDVLLSGVEAIPPERLVRWN
ncbi:NACHT domain-containing protein [Streptomyces xanthophaeus]